MLCSSKHYAFREYVAHMIEYPSHKERFACTSFSIEYHSIVGVYELDIEWFGCRDYGYEASIIFTAFSGQGG